jgi:5-methylcytosine-specific restriction endonuclease McrA
VNAIRRDEAEQGTAAGAERTRRRHVGLKTPLSKHQTMLQYCAYPGCSQQVSRGRCPAHALQAEQARPNYAVRRWYRTARWKYLRAQVLRDANYTCAQCGQVRVELDVDHRLKHDGDVRRFWDRTNLQALCPSCHAVKTARGQ